MGDRLFLATPEQLEATLPLAPARQGKNPFTGAIVDVPAARQTTEAFEGLAHAPIDEDLSGWLLGVARGAVPIEGVREVFAVRPQNVVVEFAAEWLRLSARRRADLRAHLATLEPQLAPGARWFLFANDT